nr:hypothetical protein BN993_02051 [Virgibacillus halodenitrificans]
MVGIGIFFQEQRLKSSKPVVFLQLIIAIVTAVLMVICIINDFAFIYMKWIFLLLGISSAIEGVEKYKMKMPKKAFLTDLGIACVWFVLAYSFMD